MIAVADASPLCYLVLIGEIDLLPKLFRQVGVPPAVVIELLHEDAPEVVRDWASSMPAWISTAGTLDVVVDGLEKLQAGERAAIMLAESIKADLILLDERQRAVLPWNADSASPASLAFSAKLPPEGLWTLRPPSTASGKRPSVVLPLY